MSETDSPNRPPAWKRLWIHLVDLLSSFIPIIDAVRKSWIWIKSEIKEGAADMRKGWHLFLFVGAVIGCVCFYAGCEFEKLYSRRGDNPKGRINQWQPPELEKITHQVLVKYGRSFGLYEIKDLTNPVPFEVNNSPYMGQLQGYHPFSCHVKNNRVYVDLQIATQTKPIQIKDGKIIDLPTGWQVNGNSNSFEIVSGEEIPVFQEFYPGTNQVIIKGTIRSGDKVFYLDTDNSVLISDFQSYLLGELFNRAKLAQHFTYPASEFPGVIFNK